METIRAFIAINVGDAIRQELDQLTRKLKKTQAEVRWVKPANIHLTLAFLGDIRSEQVQPLQAALQELFQGLKPFRLRARGTGFFGRPSRPRVIWAGIENSPSLTAVQQRTVQAAQTLEIDCEHKPFAPHLTLGRVKGPGHIDALQQKIGHYKDTELGTATVENVELIQSRLTPRGAEYTVLHRTGLG